MQEENRMKAKEEARCETAEAVQEMQENAAETQAGNDGAETATNEENAQVTALTAELEAKNKELEEAKNRTLRLQADFDNFRRRKNEEQEKLSQYVTASVAREFLKVLDNFERAEDSLSQAADGEALKVGMEKIHKQFEAALSALKIVEIKAQGEVFDPEIHEAVMQGQNPEAQEDTIDLVLEKGYKLGDSVIRHSKVRVVHNA